MLFIYPTNPPIEGLPSLFSAVVIFTLEFTFDIVVLIASPIKAPASICAEIVPAIFKFEIVAPSVCLKSATVSTEGSLDSSSAIVTVNPPPSKVPLGKRRLIKLVNK